MFVKSFSLLIAVTLFIATGPVALSLANNKSRVPSVSLYQTMLKANREQGWVQFRNYNKRQFVYFSALQTLHCRLKEIRFSINSTELDKTFQLVPCNTLTPFSLPGDAGLGVTAIEYPIGTVKTLAVQVTWEDGAKSDMVVYEPCPGVGERTCAVEVVAKEDDSKSGRALAPDAPVDDQPIKEGENERGASPSGTPSSN